MYPNTPYGARTQPQDAPPRRTIKRGTKWFVAAAAVAVLAFAGGAGGFVATKSMEHTAAPQPATPGSTALQRWWSEAQDDFSAVQDAAKDAQEALRVFRPGALEVACQRVHDAAEVRLQAHLPSPDTKLTAELHAAIEDYHSAAHMCLAVVAGSPVDYDGEFLSSMAEANMHMTAAHDIITTTLTTV